MTNTEIALACAARGWLVFPCKANKTPFTKNGWKDASANIPDVTVWWSVRPDALVGIACETSGIFAVDVDDTASWIQFERKHQTGAWNVGPMQRTPRGGFHLLFRLPLDITVPNNAGLLAIGVDLRSKGYVCSGSSYTWIGEGGINRPLIDAPAWLLEQIDTLNPHEQQAAQMQPVIRVEGLPGYFLEKAVQAARVGNRNNCGFDLACQLRDNGLTELEARKYLIEYASRVPQLLNHQYSQVEALASLKVAYSRPARSPITPGYGRSINGR